MKPPKKSLWEEFELLIGAIFQEVLECKGIKFDRTDLYRDGGKDGVAEFVLFGEESIFPEAQFRVWLEVKFRTGTGNLNEYDIGGNVIIALLQNVHVLYVVTNKNFTERARNGIKKLGIKLNCQVYFIGKKELLDIIDQHTSFHFDTRRLQELLSLTPEEAKRFSKQEESLSIEKKSTEKKQCSWKIRIRFLSNFDSLPAITPAKKISLKQGEFCFVAIDIIPDKYDKARQPILAVETNNYDILEIYPYYNVGHSYFSPNGYQSVYMFLPKFCGELSLGNQYQVKFNSTQNQYLEWDIDKNIHVKSYLNCEWAPKSWKEAANPLLDAMDHWLNSDGGGVVSSNIIAAAGYGKSFLIRKIRHNALHKSALKAHVRQSNILVAQVDCESIKNQRDLISALFSYLLSGDPTSFLFSDKKEWVRILETNLGLSYNASMHFIDWMQAGGRLESSPHISARDAVTVTGLLLKNVSRKRKLLLIVEDLHKTDPETFQFLIDLRAHLEHNRDSEIFLIFSSRWERSNSTKTEVSSYNMGCRKSYEMRARWSESFENLLSGINESLNIYLKPFEHNETIDILCETVTGLTTDAAKIIMRQVGTDPFSLREALLFWEMSSKDGPQNSTVAKCGGALTRRSDGTGYRLDYPENLNLERIETPNLSRATQERLSIARRRSPYIADLLEYGACLGSRFSYEVVERILLDGKENEQALMDLSYDYCRDFDLLREDPYQPNECEFAHDLLRLETIKIMSPRRHRRIAITLLDNSAYKSPLGRAELCYQAGRYDEQLHLTQEILDSSNSSARTRLVAAMLRIISLDTMTKWELLPNLPFLDWNVAVTPPTGSYPPYLVTDASKTKLLLTSYHSALLAMRSITGASNELWERLATAGALLAARCSNEESIRIFNYYSGRYYYDHMEFEKSLTLLEEVEASYQKVSPLNGTSNDRFLDKLFAKNMADGEIEAWVSQEISEGTDQDKDDLRLENLFYISFAQRHLDNSQGFFQAMHRALLLRRSGQWRAIGQAMANVGALYLHRDLNETWRYWHRGLKIMTCCGYQPYRTEFMINLGHVAMLLGREVEAENYLVQGLDLAKTNEQKGQEIRAHFHRGCLEMYRGNWPLAGKYLDTTMEVALTYSYHRRFWRVRANMANLCEAMGNIEEAAHYDYLCVQKIAPVSKSRGVNGKYELLWPITRASCALGNIGLRRLHHPDYYTWFDKVLSPEQKWVAEHLAEATNEGRLEAISGLRHFLARLGMRHRFMITD